MKDIVTLHDLTVWQLKSLYNAEIRWSAYMENITRPEEKKLKKLLQEQGSAAARHAKILEAILTELNSDTIPGKNGIVQDLTGEIVDLQERAADPEVFHAGLIVICQCFSHYKIARYGSAASFARLLQQEHIARSLHEILEEEKTTDEVFTRLAEERINIQARMPLSL